MTQKNWISFMDDPLSAFKFNSNFHIKFFTYIPWNGFSKFYVFSIVLQIYSKILKILGIKPDFSSLRKLKLHRKSFNVFFTLQGMFSSFK